MKRYEALMIKVYELDGEDIIMSVSNEWLNAHDTEFGASEFFTE